VQLILRANVNLLKNYTTAKTAGAMKTRDLGV
jgi:hypothetical protein